MPVASKSIITRLDPGALTTLVTRLVSAELGRLGAPVGTLVVSDDLNESDEGLDGLIRDSPAIAADGSPSLLPSPDLLGIQLKATKKKNPSAFQLTGELCKPGPSRVIEAGGTYLLVSGQDLNPAQRTALENALSTAADARAKELGAPSPVKTWIWDAQALSDLCDRHPAPIIDLGLEAYGATFTLGELMETLQADRRPYRADAKRTEVLELLQARIDTTTDHLIANVQGLPGTGKTRLIAELLNRDDLRDRVVYVNGPDALRALTVPLRRNEASGGIVIADEVDDHEASEFTTAIAALGGRWRVIAVRGQTSTRFVAESPRSIVVPPLDGEAMRGLIEEHSGLDSIRAARVAEVAEGFPELAFRLSEELIAEPDLDLIRLAHLPRPAELLKRALPNTEDRRHLGPIALFSRVGFDDDVAYQVAAVAEAFGLDENDLRRAVDAQSRRFASVLGRYRQVSPLLVAVWLATEVIETTGNFTDLVFGLPDPLQSAFVDQLELFGPDVPHLPKALAQVLNDPRFRSGSDFDAAAGRLLRAAAAIVPAQVASALMQLVATSSADEVRSLPRRELVETSVRLLWDPDSWDSAATVLLALATEENEAWANNATGEFTRAFGMYLSGSTVPYGVRADWLEAAIRSSDPERMELLAAAAAAPLSDHEVRMHSGSRGGFEPSDWRPTSREEIVSARARAWELLMMTLEKAPTDQRSELVTRIGACLRSAYRSGIQQEVNGSLRGTSWSESESAELASQLARVLRYEKELPAEMRASIEDLRRTLIGESLPERLNSAYRTSVWDLHAEGDDYAGAPQAVRDLVREVAARPDAMDLVTSIGRDLDDQQTRYVFAREFALVLGPDLLGSVAYDSEDWTLLAACLSIADEAELGPWATGTIRRLGSSAPGRVIEMYLAAGPEEARTELVLQLIRDRQVSPTGLGNLLFGGRVVALSRAQAMTVIEVVAEEGSLEQALGMLDQWLHANEPQAGDADLAFALALAALDGDETTMTEHYVEQLLDSGLLAGDQVIALWQRRTETRRGLVDRLDLRLTDAGVQLDAVSMLDRAEALIRRQADGDLTAGYFALTDLALLSRIADVAGIEAVWQRMAAWDDRTLGFALHHLEWRGQQPDALTHAFLESERLVSLSREATLEFLNSLGVVVGSMADAQERERTRVQAWRARLESSSAQAWASDVEAELQTVGALYRRREEEEGFR